MEAETKQAREDVENLERLYHAPYLRGAEVPSVRPVLEKLALGADDIVVEFGSDDGHFTLPIARYFEEQQGRGVVFACDFSRTLVDDLAQKATVEGVDNHVRTICLGDIRPHTLPLKNERVQAVVSVNALQYLSDPEPYMMEIARVLVPCGKMIVADWRKPVSVNQDGLPHKVLAPAQLYPVLEAAGAAGLEANVELAPRGYSWVISAVKPKVFSLSEPLQNAETT